MTDAMVVNSTGVGENGSKGIGVFRVEPLNIDDCIKNPQTFASHDAEMRKKVYKHIHSAAVSGALCGHKFKLVSKFLLEVPEGVIIEMYLENPAGFLEKISKTFLSDVRHRFNKILVALVEAMHKKNALKQVVQEWRIFGTTLS